MWKFLVGVLVLAAVVTVFFLNGSGDARRAETISVQRGSVESRLELTGTVTNDRTVTLTALLDGEITAILAREGDLVEAGAVLAELDPRQAQALLDKAGAELVLQQQSLEAAERNYQRISRLSRAGNASAQALDDSLDQKLLAQSSLKAAEATLTLNQLRRDNAQIKAPFAGTVIEQSAETGQWLEAGRPLFELVATEGMVIEAAVSTSDWFKLNVGQRVELSASVASDDFWVSEVSWIAPSVDQDNSQGNRVAVRFPPGDDAPPLLLGQEVDVNLSLERVNDVIVLPLQAVIEESPELSVVYVLDGDQARRRTVSLGLSSLTNVEVVDGLSEGEIVILPGGQPLREGQSVLLN